MFTTEGKKKIWEKKPKDDFPPPYQLTSGPLVKNQPRAFCLLLKM